MWQVLAVDGWQRRWALAAVVYLSTTWVFMALANPSLFEAHTPYNHFALLAHSWLEGRLDLGGGPPDYAGHNDFAEFQGRWYVVFPPFPALLLLPWVAAAADPLRVRDGLVFLGLAGIGPAVLFLALEKLRRTGRSTHGVGTNLGLTWLLAFGTVYFFSAEQGTVWFAAHVVGLGLAAMYLRFSLDAERPILAGLVLGLGGMTRAPLLFAFPLFILEAARVAQGNADARETAPRRDAEFWRKFACLCLLFAVPLLLTLAVTSAHNWARFGDPREFGYRYLDVAWRSRMEKWGLFHYHYLAKNLGVVLTSLPWITPSRGPASFQINAHGLALWVTSPFFVWLLWPTRRSALRATLWATVALVAIPTLFYQNTGWVQFGYRFSNDYSVFLMALLAVGQRRFSKVFIGAALVAVAINAFGAISFDRSRFADYYYIDPSQRAFYQTD